MGERRRILSSPLHVAGGLALDQLGSLVAIDATLRWWANEGIDGEALLVPFSGSLATQHAVERELAKEGHDRETLGRDGFAARVRVAEDAWCADARELLVALEVSAGQQLTSASIDSDDVLAAARVAFVRLFDAGLLRLTERVVDMCPRCGTVVHAADAERGTIAGEVLTLRLELSNGDELQVTVPHPELVAGAVAVVVAPGDHAAGSDALVPAIGRWVPVVADEAVRDPALAVPGHDAASHAMALREGLMPIEVLDAEGIVQEPPALAGLTRFAARTEAASLLAADGAVVARQPADELVARCRGCGTVLVPRLGRHWFLRTKGLEVAAADAVREGTLTFSPAAARQGFINWAGHSDDWCLSHQLWGGHAIPVATCTDCGEPAVGIDPPHACRKCMAPLAADTACFDARFLGVMWSLVAAAGWPVNAGVGRGRNRPPTHSSVTLAVRPGGLFTWAVPAAALGLHLMGTIPFDRVVVHEPCDDALAAGAAGRLLAAGTAAARLAVLGDLDAGAARDLARRAAAPPSGDADAVELVAALRAAFADARPGAAVPALATALEAGIPSGDRVRLERIVAPLVGRGLGDGGADGLG